MMRLTVKEVALTKGYKNAKQLTRAMTEYFGVKISFSTIYPMWDDTAQLWSRQTVDRLCEFLQVPSAALIHHIPVEALQSSILPELEMEREAKVKHRSELSKQKRERLKDKANQ